MKFDEYLQKRSELEKKITYYTFGGFGLSFTGLGVFAYNVFASRNTSLNEELLILSVLINVGGYLLIKKGVTYGKKLEMLKKDNAELEELLSF